VTFLKIKNLKILFKNPGYAPVPLDLFEGHAELHNGVYSIFAFS